MVVRKKRWREIYYVRGYLNSNSELYHENEKEKEKEGNKEKNHARICVSFITKPSILVIQLHP